MATSSGRSDATHSGACIARFLKALRRRMTNGRTLQCSRTVQARPSTTERANEEARAHELRQPPAQLDCSRRYSPETAEHLKTARAAADPTQLRSKRGLVLPPHNRTRLIRNVAPVVRVERGASAQPVAA